jgi:hypothetical protein
MAPHGKPEEHLAQIDRNGTDRQMKPLLIDSTVWIRSRRIASSKSAFKVTEPCPISDWIDIPGWI